MSGPASPPGAQISYRRQYRRCGKAGCARCAAGGPGHGPYWYAYWWADGRSHSRYLGKQAPPDLALPDRAWPDASPPEAGPPSPAYAAAMTTVAHVGELPLPADAAGSPASAQSTAGLRVSTLGRFAVWRGATLLEPGQWRSQRAATLFKCLLSVPGHRLAREQAIDLLWPEGAWDAGARNLRTTIHRLRQALDDPQAGLVASYLRTEGAMIALAPGGAAPPADAWLDADAFARSAQGALAGTDLVACRAALALYGGEYLPSDRYAAWAEPLRTALRRLYLDLLLHLAALSGARGELEESKDCLRRVLATEPGHEEAAATLMGLLAASGRRAEALRVYQALATVLEDDLAVAPSAEIVALRARLVAQEDAPLAATLPPRQGAALRRTNLPAAATSFVGRSWELAAIAEALATGRLVTLTGPGGCGKTRLALEVAERLVEAYPDGVWLVELAALADSAQVGRALVGALGMVERAGRSVPDALVDFLQPRHLLVVLDNCEHLIGACAELTTVLLQSCPHLRLLATSRERLEVAGEQTYLVPSLAVPDLANLPALDLLATYEAVQLFVERARARRPDLALTAANAGAIAQICARLDGLPLAIELAAARAGAMRLAAIAARLDDRFRLLTGGPRTALPRQQTLRATLEWSYELLTDPERVLLRRLAVFAGGCTLAAAEAVCADPASTPPHATRAGEYGTVLDLLSKLVQKSLVQFDEPRYRLLETVRQYGHERLLESGEEAVLRQQHATYFSALAEHESQRPPQAGQALWFEQATVELDNLRGALRWFLDAEQGEHALRLAVLLAPFWDECCYYAEGQRWLAEALAASPAAPTRMRADGFHWSSMVATFRGEVAQGMALGEEAVRLLREVGDRRSIPRTLAVLGLAASQQGDYTAALLYIEEFEALCRELGEMEYLANALQLYGQVALNQGDYERAVIRAEESIAITREHGPRRFLVHSLDDLARALLCRGELRRAISLWAEGLQIALEWPEKQQIAYYLEGFACTAAQQGHLTRAARLAGAADALRQEVSSPISVPEAMIVERFLAPARAQLDAALWQRAWDHGHAMTLEQAVAEAWDEYGAPALA